MIELAIAAVIAALSGAGVSIPLASRHAINRLRQQLLEEARDEANLLAQREATAMAEAEANRLALAEKQSEINQQQLLLLVEKNRRDELDLEDKRLEAARLEAENLERQHQIEMEKSRQLELDASMGDERLRMAEIEAEAQRIQEEQRKEAAVLAGEERKRAEERQKLDDVREHELALERERAEIARLELEKSLVGEREQQRLDQHRRHCRRIAEDLKEWVPFAAVEALLEGNTVSIHVDSCEPEGTKCWLEDSEWPLKALIEIALCLDLPIAQSMGWKITQSRRSTIKELLIAQSSSSTNLGAALKSTDFSIIVLANKHLDYLRWEMALVAAGKVVLLDASTVAPIPTCQEELVATFGGLFKEMFSLLAQPSHKVEVG